MAYQARQRDPLFDRDTQAVLERRGKELLGCLLLAVAVLSAMVLGSYSQDDPSWMSITNEPAENLLGRFGATLAQPVYVVVGWGGWVIPALFAVWGLRFLSHRGEDLAMSRAVFGPIAMALASVYAATHVPSATWTHTFGMGGMLGDTVLGAALNFLPFGSGFGLKLLTLVLAVAVLAMSLFAMGFTKPELEVIGRFLMLSLVMTYATLLRWISSAVEATIRVTRSGGGATLRGGLSLATKASDWQASRREAKAEARSLAARRPAQMAQPQDYDEVFEDEPYVAPQPAPAPHRRVAAVVRSQIQAERRPASDYDAELAYDEQPYDEPRHSTGAARRAAAAEARMAQRQPLYADEPVQGEWGGGRVLEKSREPRPEPAVTGWQAIDAYQPVQRAQPKPSLLSRVPSFLMRQVASAAAPALAAAPQPLVSSRQRPEPELEAAQTPRDDQLNARIANAINARRQQVTAPTRNEPPVMRLKGPRPILFDPSKYPTGRAVAAEVPPVSAAESQPEARYEMATDPAESYVQTPLAAPPAASSNAARAAAMRASSAMRASAASMGAASAVAGAALAAPAPRGPAASELASQAPAASDFDSSEPDYDETAFDTEFEVDDFSEVSDVQPVAPVAAPLTAGPLVKPRVMLRATASVSPSSPPLPSVSAVSPRHEPQEAEPPTAIHPSGSRLIRAGQDAGAFAAVQGDELDDDEAEEGDLPYSAPVSAVGFAPSAEPKKVVQHPLQRQILPSKQARAEAQPRVKFEDRHPGFEKPPLALLMNPEEIERHLLSDEALEENARLLESVLDDYGVRGEIVSVRPGPVVTMYELEPAPGLKASRVIGLSDDIARSMKALSARVSTVPGRSVIGIELPNERREKVVLREIMSARDFGDTNMRLPLALGKDIGGEPVVANLAKMPHLLIAGTTGSGKSVAINTMILSLLYRLTPEECRLIMIDPKMLELSVYDGIPHLLSPVVTDPKKAVVALKWVVGEMEERYRKMSKMGVRNIEGYNGRVRDAIAKGEMFKRTIQTGFDEETGDPVFETDEFEPQPFPYIVVIVDEMADLMMVAGKEIEACIQRLAQMARASGIHLIMATQRPSVDVITGTIKANFPTRISFQVTSKIDSRTILGEMGAEQLLGMGDMLYMAGGGRISRVHGPFVSDEEVEEVVNHLKSFGPPEYVGSVVEGPDDNERSEGTSVDELLGLGSEKEGDEALYDMAVAIVAKDRKCSTSYIQRKLAIGYNKAARLVEQMEDQGVVSRANHVGKREILVPEVQ